MDLKYIPPTCRDLLDKLLKKDPSMRPSLNEIMEHPWFNGIDWTAMERMELEPVYKPPLTSECDTQFFSKEFTSFEILNPEESPNAGGDGGD